MKENKIFIYLRLRDNDKIIFTSRIREFAALGRLLVEFIRELCKYFSLDILSMGTLEYVEANSDIILISFTQNKTYQKIIISGLIPLEYQSRMLYSDENLIDDDWMKRITSGDVNNIVLLRQNVFCAIPDILKMVQDNINEYGEFYFSFSYYFKNSLI